MVPHGLGIHRAGMLCVMEHYFAQGFLSHLSLVWKRPKKETIHFCFFEIFALELIF
jgi:hypothetical protein